MISEIAKQGKVLIKNITKAVTSYPSLPVSVDCVIFGFDENELKILLIRSEFELYKDKWCLIGGFPTEDERFEDAAKRVLKERTGLDNVFLEEVKTFSKPNRHPGGRIATVAYCSLLNTQHSQLKILDNELHWHNVSSIKEMGFDHREILDTCYLWLQKRVQEHPLGFNLLPDKFSLRELQNLYEAILGVSLDRRNFRKKIASLDVLIDINEMEQDVPHRPGKLYKFNVGKSHHHKRKLIGIDF
jgi:8-oxo-dGTP diphosphatase